MKNFQKVSEKSGINLNKMINRIKNRKKIENLTVKGVFFN